ncbi:Uncharacterised protein [Pluralibacter gergoviae]|nr:Uncharacterised protein [Pluralibacter gergoviae]
MPLGTSAPETMTTTSAFLRQAALQRQLFAEAIEIIGRGDLFHQLRDNAFAEHQLTRGQFVGGQGEG